MSVARIIPVVSQTHLFLVEFRFVVSISLFQNLTRMNALDIDNRHNHSVTVSRTLLVGRSVADYSRSWIGHRLSNRMIVKSCAGRCGGCRGRVLKSMLCEYRCRQCRRCDTKVTQLHLRLRGKAVERARAFTSTACEIDDRLAETVAAILAHTLGNYGMAHIDGVCGCTVSMYGVGMRVKVCKRGQHGIELNSVRGMGICNKVDVWKCRQDTEEVGDLYSSAWKPEKNAETSKGLVIDFCKASIMRPRCVLTA